MEMFAHSAQFSIAPTAPTLPADCHLPGHPQRPVLRHHTEVARRSPASLEGRITLMHAIAHIEFNAIDLAWDAVYRFRGLPDDFYADWVRVAGSPPVRPPISSARPQHLPPRLAARLAMRPRLPRPPSPTRHRCAPPSARRPSRN